MPRGGPRATKPTELKVLHGTARKDRLPKNEPKPRPTTPSMPDDFDEWSQECWRRNVPILENMRVLTEADADMLEAYCASYSRFKQANARLKRIVAEAGDDMSQIRPAEVSVEKAEHSMRLLAAEFGLTPAARGRLSVPEGSIDDDSILHALWQDG